MSSSGETFSYEESYSSDTYNPWNVVDVCSTRRPKIWSISKTETQRELEEEIASLDAKMRSLISALEEADAARQIAIERLNAEESRRPPPIMNVPVDILMHLFKLALDDEEGRVQIEVRTHLLQSGMYREAGNLLARVQMVLSQVCRRWRDLSFSMPSLWTRYFVLDTPTPDNPMVETWMKRAGAAPLQLSIESCTRVHLRKVEFRTNPCPRFDDLVDPVVERLCFLRLEGCEHTCSDVVSLIRDRAVLLCEFHWDCHLCTNRVANHFGEQPFRPNLLQQSPRLVPIKAPNVSVASFSGDASTFQHFAGAQLKELSLGLSVHTHDLEWRRYLTTREFLAVFNSFVSLQRLAINIEVLPHRSPSDDDPVVFLPNLSSLRVKTREKPMSSFAWLHRFDMPLLTRLELMFRKHEYPRPGEDEGTAEYLLMERQFLDRFPNLLDLQLAWSNYARRRVAFFAQLLTEGLFPRLEHLSFGDSPEGWNVSEWTGTEVRKLTELVNTRWRHGTPLKTIEAVQNHRWSPGPGKNYAVEFLTKLGEKVDDLAELEDFGIADLF